MQGRLKREARHRSSGRTGRHPARARAAGTYSESAGAYGPPDVGVNAPPYGSQGIDTCCSCGVGQAGPPGAPGEDGAPGILIFFSKIYLPRKSKIITGRKFLNIRKCIWTVYVASNITMFSFLGIYATSFFTFILGLTVTVLQWLWRHSLA